MDLEIDKESNKINKSLSLKILINYLQVLGLANSINLNWNSIEKSIFEMNTKIGKADDQIFSFDCLIPSYFFNYSRLLFYFKVT